MERVISSVAVFVLATTRAYWGQTSFDNRMVPVADTWGRAFKHLHFVMGTNMFDKNYLTRHCKMIVDYPIFQGEEEGPTNHRRMLRVSSRQVASSNRSLLYECDYSQLFRKRYWRQQKSRNITEYTGDQKPGARKKPLRVVFTGNCTGEYMGRGPTCRCQEAIRFYLKSPKFQHTQWFSFIDDDLYLRPYGTMTLLNMINAKMQASPVAMVASNYPHGFKFSKSWDKKRHKCHHGTNMSNKNVYNVHIASPVFINRNAITHISSFLDVNGMTALQDVWRGTHDMILGVLLWMYQVPLYSVADVYSSGIYYKEDSAVFGKKKDILVHMVKNLKSVQKDKKQDPVTNKLITSKTVKHMPSMYDVEYRYHDYRVHRYLHRVSGGNMWQPAWMPQVVREQINNGTVGFERYSKLLKESGVGRTLFATFADTLKDKFVVFRPEHCPLRDDTI